jgi:hypothetical protein
VSTKPIIECMHKGECEKSHSIVIGSMGDDYNQIGEVFESKKQDKGEKLLWETTIVLDIKCFCMNN